MPPSLMAADVHRVAPTRAASGHALGDAFWSSFHATHWERVGAVIEQPFATPLATPAELFDAMVEASDRFRAGDASVSLEFCIGHTRMLADVARYLPEHADGGSTGYMARITQLLGGARFGLVVEDAQAYDATLWLRLRDFLRGLYQHTGLPGDAAKATVFLGNYDRTPFGLHRGSSANFMFVVEGAKRMRTWPDAYFRGKPDLTHRLDYEAYNADAIVMDANPGDIIFWPSDYWHIGESVDGGFSSAVSVALFMEPRPTAAVMARAAGLVGAHHAEAGRTRALDAFPGDMRGAVERVDAMVEDAVASLEDVSADRALRHALRVGALNTLTGFGFTRPPRPREGLTLADDMVVSGSGDFPMLWVDADDDDLVVSANGHALQVAASPHVLALLERVNSGERLRVGSLVEAHSGTVRAGGVEFETTRDDVRALVAKLVSLRALTTD